ncbi:hypothetical protein Syun_005133 [Stephania yunnanensis]|uniref:Periodic tryptophan protein 1 n=1 Tax=Stephania yunnanensis TaxID=152371 RepID=A0AAP0Q5L9_9MAGN
MISAISWVPKGASKAVPSEVEPPSKEEIEEMLKNGSLDRSEDIEDEKEDMDVDTAKRTDEVAQALAAADAVGKASETGNGTKDIENALKGLDMDHYDDEDGGIELFSTGPGDTYYPSNELDPYLKDKDDDDEEVEDTTIKPSDAVIICASNEDDVCILEEFEDGEHNLFSHHDIILPAFPLCTAWLDCGLKGGDKGNFVAVGSMDPAIEIWDLDVIDEVQPIMSSVKYKPDSHTDSVLGLAWNKTVRKYLASASADTSVQAVDWNKHVPDVLLSGSFDHSVVLVDMRYPSHTGIKSEVASDVESLAWDPHDQHSFVVSLEDGTVQSFDVRAAASNPASGCKPCFTLHAHDKAVSTVSFNPAAPKMLATGSTDKTVKLWDLANNQPSCVASRNPKAGAVFSISFSEDSPFLLAIGGSKGSLQIWDTLTETGIAQRFGKNSKGKADSKTEE